MNKSIKIQIRDGIDPMTALRRIGYWYEANSSDPIKTPMTGVVVYTDGIVLFKREYRQSDCFVVHKEEE